MSKNRFFSILLIGYLSVTNVGADAGNGAHLFEGSASFENGGVSCVSCHNASNVLVINGGALAKDLTKAISVYGGVEAGAGETVKAMISDTSAMPSPIMAAAYKGKELTKNEVTDLVDFLIKADSEATAPSNNSNSFIISGIVGAIIIFVLLSIFGRKRKRESVNQAIYDRQIKSSWKESKE